MERPVHGKHAPVAVGDVGGDAERYDRRAWRRSQWIEVTLTLAFFAAVAAMDWVLNGSLELLRTLSLGLAAGVVVGAALLVRRRRSRRM